MPLSPTLQCAAADRPAATIKAPPAHIQSHNSGRNLSALSIICMNHRERSERFGCSKTDSRVMQHTSISPRRFICVLVVSYPQRCPALCNTLITFTFPCVCLSRACLGKASVFRSLSDLKITQFVYFAPVQRAAESQRGTPTPEATQPLVRVNAL